jgi:hypothetical protein
MQDTQFRTGENSFLLFSHAGYPVQDRRKLFFPFFTCRIPSSGQEKIIFYFFHIQDTQFRTGENYFLLFSHAGYPVQDRRKFSATYLFHTSQPR